ncbi:hypothetical protein KAM644c_24450 [Klebsiella quasipneumoniae subsp. quasipneumoniae]|uniref:Uncharacterized protein n=2 Tax=Klebsiella quasipneumoniae TaxID=1463165 RepID=A0AAN1Y4X7_9ENTR|nr:hypothetical protein KAM622c_25140 [Klebsiella quasipneumoniae subsp. quasipneumoniae]BDO13379.1 hypothetical protein KAM644c_24450 [Klebsiella quasipneumoniae subsp. quasipneumoniae]BDO19354.1 hypothetical protein KAM645c_24440 [Klebsiella quasipneumoniae subsp. quasipneumoniae]
MLPDRPAAEMTFSAQDYLLIQQPSNILTIVNNSIFTGPGMASGDGIHQAIIGIVPLSPSD